MYFLTLLIQKVMISKHFYELSKNSSKKILDSTEGNPIKLRLTRLEYNGGTSAPICYSHITNVEVISE